MAATTALRLEYLQLDQPGLLGFPADDRIWVPTWDNAQACLTPFRSGYRNIILSDVVKKTSSFLSRKLTLSFPHRL